MDIVGGIRFGIAQMLSLLECFIEFKTFICHLGQDIVGSTIDDGLDTIHPVHDEIAGQRSNDGDTADDCRFKVDRDFIGVSQFKKLIETKRYIEKLEIVRDSLKDFDPGDAYDKVIEFIQNAEMPDADELSLEAKKLRRKIPVEYNVLYKAIRDLARSSYKEIYDYLEKNEAKYTDGSTFIGRKIKTLSDSLMAKGLNPQEVYDAIVSALVSKFPDDKNAQNACYYLVAFFTVHCEVLNNETA